MQSWKGVLHLIDLCGQMAIEGLQALVSRRVEVSHSLFQGYRTLIEVHCAEICQDMKKPDCTIAQLNERCNYLRRKQYAMIHVYHPGLQNEGLIVNERRMLTIPVDVYCIIQECNVHYSTV